MKNFTDAELLALVQQENNAYKLNPTGMYQNPGYW